MRHEEICDAGESLGRNKEVFIHEGQSGKTDA